MTINTEIVEYLGERFHVGEKIGAMPMLRYARSVKRVEQRARAGTEADGMDELEILDATLSLLEQCVHPDEWDRFVDTTAAAAWSQDDYMNFAGEVMAVMATRPSRRSSDSSDGPQTISPNSTVDSSSPATAVVIPIDPRAERIIEDFNSKGRPDLALLVRRTQEQRSA